MVQTRSAAKKIESGQGHADDGVFQKDVIIEPLLENPTSNPAKKPRRRNLAPPTKRRRRRPGELCQLNLDVLFLIAAYIHPIDLLNLARTCKSLRELLMGKSSAFVWKTARQQAEGLPDCPADLTEPEYANLVFCARCHDCGKYTTTIFWNIRRRYCTNCRIRRLRRLSNCAEVIRVNKTVVPVERMVVKNEYNTWCDRNQVASFMHEYRQVSDRKQFINDRQNQYEAIREHAKKCEAFEARRAKERKDDLKARRAERRRSIFERLEQHGYKPEMIYFGHSRIEQYREFDFKTIRPLTSDEWDRIWPEWLEIMNRIRPRRIEEQVFRPRLRLLRSKYDEYVTQPSPEAPTFDLLPHVTDVARFPPFWDILKAPEGTEVNGLFASAFAQLPVIVPKWREKIDGELAELVQIPPQLILEPTSQTVASSRTTHVGSLNVDPDKLGLACALFQGWSGVLRHPEALLVSGPRYSTVSGDADLEHPGSISCRFNIQFLEEAPYIIHACGLDPNVAKMDDMDRRNARLKCLCCNDRPDIVMDWRNAMRHAHLCHRVSSLLPLSELPRWELVDDKHIDAIQNVEQSPRRNNQGILDSVRCLLCKPRMGDACWGGRYMGQPLVDHLSSCHHLTRGDLKQGIHYVLIDVPDSGLTMPVP